MSGTSKVSESVRSAGDARIWWMLTAALAAWAGLYAANELFWPWLFGSAFRLDRDTQFWSSVEFFFYDSIKISLLLVGLLFVVGLVNTQLSPERVRDVLTGKGLFVGMVLAVFLGAVTPFCSCSSIPIFIGLVAAGVPLSITLTFLIASPLISETGIILMGGSFGWDIAGLWLLAGVAVALLAGFVLSRFHLEKWVEPFVFESKTAVLARAEIRPTMQERVQASWDETRGMLIKVIPYLLLGVAIGAAIHGWVPAEFITSIAGPQNPFALLFATLAGAPLYSSPASVVPLAAALFEKGAALGTVMAFMMSLVALSIPSLIMLRRVMKPPLLALFTGVVLVGIFLIGLLFNLISI